MSVIVNDKMNEREIIIDMFNKGLSEYTYQEPFKSYQTKIELIPSSNVLKDFKIEKENSTTYEYTIRKTNVILIVKDKNPPWSLIEKF